MADTKLLFRSIPAAVTALFVISVVTMNILANKTIYQSEILALDGGILVSWLSFLCMDIITKATMLNIILTSVAKIFWGLGG